MEFIIAILFFLLASYLISFIHYKPDSKQFKKKSFRHIHTHTDTSLYAYLTSNTKERANQFMSAEEKQTYLQSTEWKSLRNQVFARDNHTCQSCGSQSSLNCHHITYERLGAENLEDLITLCGGPNGCHTKLHKLLGYDRTTIYNITKD